MRASTLIRCAQASSRMFSVVVMTLTALDGETESTSLEATIREVSGERRGALVAFGSASRLTKACLAFLGTLPLAGWAIIPTALGVGVAGVGTAVFGTRFLFGVTGAAGTSSCADAAFLFRPFGGAGGGMDEASAALRSAAALKRADRRLAIVSESRREAWQGFGCVQARLWAARKVMVLPRVVGRQSTRLCERREERCE